MIIKANEALDKNPKDKNTKFEINANLLYLEELLGIGYKNPFEYFQIGIDANVKKQIESLIEQRNIAKKEKDFAKADEIRELLTCKGILLMDTPQGTLWEKAE